MSNAVIIAFIPLLPLAGFLLLGLFGRTTFKNYSGIIGTLLLAASTVLAVYTAYDYFAHSSSGVYARKCH
jgi:NADH-quinone oxidoreductase subunit L